MKNSILIEFFGLPGSGKSTISQEVEEKLRNSKYNVVGRKHLFQWRRSLKFREKIFIFFQAFVLSVSYPKLMFYSFKIREIRQFFKLFTKIIYLNRFYKSVEPSIMIFDQWLMQDIWSINVFQDIYNSKSILKRLTPVFALAHVYIFLKISEVEVAKRIAKRSNGNSRFDGNSMELIKNRLSGKGELFEQIHESLSFTSGSKILTYDGSKTTNFLANQIERDIQSLDVF